jgi:hypothetical protein
MTWTLLLAAEGSADPPAARADHGFTSAGGRLFVHGGKRMVTGYEYGNAFLLFRDNGEYELDVEPHA